MTPERPAPARALRMPQPCWRSPDLVRAAAALLVAACITGAAHADEREVLIKHGVAVGSYDRTGVAVRFEPFWATDRGRWRFTLRPEAELGQFRYSGPRSGPSSLTQGGVNGLLRAQFGNGSVVPYGEIGLGVSLFSRDRLGGKEFSTHFQFSQHVGAGVEFDHRWLVGWHYTHYSNADIVLPNNGIDLHQVMIGARF